MVSCGKSGSNLIVQEVNFYSADGIPLKGMFYTIISDSLLPGVALGHMYQHDKSSWDGFARKLAERGIAVLAFDFRGWGESGGEVDIANNYKDVIAAAKYLADMSRVDRRRVGAAGASMGGMAVVCAAANSQLIKAAVSIAAPPSWQGCEPEQEAGQMSPRPLLVIAGSKDPKVSLKLARRIFDAAGEPKQWLVIDTDKHGTDIFSTDKAGELEEALFQFFNKELRASE